MKVFVILYQPIPYEFKWYLHEAYTDYKSAVIELDKQESRFPYMEFQFLTVDNEPKKFIAMYPRQNLDALYNYQEMQREHYYYQQALDALCIRAKGLAAL